MKTIKDLIQFAIDNGFNLRNTSYTDLKIECNRIKYLDKDRCTYWYDNLIEIITSKPFIEAIARGLSNETNKWMSDFFIKWWLEWAWDEITTQLAIAIRENSVDNVSLNKFINNFLKNDYTHGKERDGK